MPTHERFDPGSLYGEKWTQIIIAQIQTFLQSHIEWVGLSSGESQRVVDYACGNGTVSTALLDHCPNATFQGLDNHPAQIERFNKIAADRLGDSNRRMWAVRGDLMNLSDTILAPEWYGFDVAVISMALHHVEDPIAMLTRLRERVKPGGMLLVVEMTPEGVEPVQHVGDTKRNTHWGHSHHAPHMYSGHGMVEVVGGQHIWPAFTISRVTHAMQEAGFVDMEGREYQETFEVPEGMGPGGTKRLIFVRGVVA